MLVQNLHKPPPAVQARRHALRAKVADLKHYPSWWLDANEATRQMYAWSITRPMSGQPRRKQQRSQGKSSSVGSDPPKENEERAGGGAEGDGEAAAAAASVQANIAFLRLQKARAMRANRPSAYSPPSKMPRFKHSLEAGHAVGRARSLRSPRPAPPPLYAPPPPPPRDYSQNRSKRPALSVLPLPVPHHPLPSKPLPMPTSMLHARLAHPPRAASANPRSLAGSRIQHMPSLLASACQHLASPLQLAAAIPPPTQLLAHTLPLGRIADAASKSTAASVPPAPPKSRPFSARARSLRPTAAEDLLVPQRLARSPRPQSARPSSKLAHE